MRAVFDARVVVPLPVVVNLCYQVEERRDVVAFHVDADAARVVANIVEIHARGHDQTVARGKIAKDANIFGIMERVEHLEAAQTVACELEPLDSRMSLTTRMV